MTLPVRKIAADARLAAEKVGVTGAENVAIVREAIKKNFERGFEAGQKAEQKDSAAVHPRYVLLTTAVYSLDSMREQMERVPGSSRQTHALREAAAILRDAAELTP